MRDQLPVESGPLDVLIDPSVEELLGLLRTSMQGEVRGIHTTEGRLVLWDAYLCVHDPVRDALNRQWGWVTRNEIEFILYERCSDGMQQHVEQWEDLAGIRWFAADRDPAIIASWLGSALYRALRQRSIRQTWDGMSPVERGAMLKQIKESPHSADPLPGRREHLNPADLLVDPTERELFDAVRADRVEHRGEVYAEADGREHAIWYSARTYIHGDFDGFLAVRMQWTPVRCYMIAVLTGERAACDDRYNAGKRTAHRGFDVLTPQWQVERRFF